MPLQPLEHLSLNNACKSNVFSRYSQAQVVKTITFVSVIGDIRQQTIRGRYSENWLSMPLNEATNLLISFYFISIIRFIHITVRYMYDEFWLKQLIDNIQSNVKMKYMYKSYPFYKTNISLQPSELLRPVVICIYRLN